MDDKGFQSLDELHNTIIPVVGRNLSEEHKGYTNKLQVFALL